MQYTIDDLIKIVAALRAENGCPWDKVQTHESIKKSLIEEVYEAIDALDSGNDRMFANELGDVLLQVVFHAQIAKERGAFDFDTCVNEICNKLISRHSHVFGEDKASNAAESLDIWEKNKFKEKGLQNYTDALNDVPHSLPALMRAEKVLKKAAGFKSDLSDAGNMLEEKINEFKRASGCENIEDKENKFGELLLAAVNLGRAAGVTSETALYKSVNDFIKNFAEEEKKINADAKKMNELSDDELSVIWNKITKKR